MFKCGDSVTFTYKGSVVTYGTVESQGECWMDRNLGALKVADAYNDSDAYGDLFQWGRGDDGHQDRNSETTTTLSSTDNPGHSNFIMTPNQPFDWRSPQNDNLWQGVSGINNPCPNGWRLPTSAEWETELVSWSQDDYNGAFATPLKLTAGGSRGCGLDDDDATLYDIGSFGGYWSSSVDSHLVIHGREMSGMTALTLYFYSGNANTTNYTRAGGFSIRCIKD
jgi:uncharacterized protein (TIGR02145 family)